MKMTITAPRKSEQKFLWFLQFHSHQTCCLIWTGSKRFPVLEEAFLRSSDEKIKAITLGISLRLIKQLNLLNCFGKTIILVVWGADRKIARFSLKENMRKLQEYKLLKIEQNRSCSCCMFAFLNKISKCNDSRYMFLGCYKVLCNYVLLLK